MTDPIADMLSRIRNASAVKKTEVVMPFSKVKFNIAKILKHEGYLGEAVMTETRKGVSQLLIKLKYDEKSQPVIRNLKRISRPGRRLYVGKDELPRVLNNLGVAVVSTSKGLMTNKQARRDGLGGEIICEIY
ncbi:MAG: 30S ribosomal protein S8 [bacterium]